MTLASAAVAVLAQRLYIAHITFLKAEIKALEEKLLRNYKDIEDIERGDWDEKFKAQIDAANTIVEVVAMGDETETRRDSADRKRNSSLSDAGDSEEPPAKRSRVDSAMEMEEVVSADVEEKPDLGIVNSGEPTDQEAVEKTFDMEIEEQLDEEIQQAESDPEVNDPETINPKPDDPDLVEPVTIPPNKHTEEEENPPTQQIPSAVSSPLDSLPDSPKPSSEPDETSDCTLFPHPL